jgi:hypothetical protein
MYIILTFLIIVSTVVNIIYGRRYIDLFDEDSINKLKKYNYRILEIKRKRRSRGSRGGNASLPYNEHPLEIEYPVPWSIISPEDIIEVYGMDGNNKCLIYKTEWSKNNIIKIKEIVNKLNEKLNNN